MSHLPAIRWKSISPGEGRGDAGHGSECQEGCKSELAKAGHRCGLLSTWEPAVLNGLLRKPREGRLYVWVEYRVRTLVWKLSIDTVAAKYCRAVRRWAAALGRGRCGAAGGRIVSAHGLLNDIRIRVCRRRPPDRCHGLARHLTGVRWGNDSRGNAGHGGKREERGEAGHRSLSIDVVSVVLFASPGTMAHDRSRDCELAHILRPKAKSTLG